MVLTLLIPLRYLFRLQHIITQDHIGAMCKIITLATGMMVGLRLRVIEFFIAWYSGQHLRASSRSSTARSSPSLVRRLTAMVLQRRASCRRPYWIKKVRQTNGS